jgi:hypothetical protein
LVHLRRPSLPGLGDVVNLLAPRILEQVGVDSSIIGARPRFSAWSDTTRKSNGRIRRARVPVDDTTISPRAKRSASSGPSRLPSIPESVE